MSVDFDTDPGLSPDGAVDWLLAKRRRLSELPDGDILVRQSSPKWMHFEIYLRASCLFVQEGYATTQWNIDRPSAKDHPKDKVEGHLLVENGVIIGAASFWRHWKDSAWSWQVVYIDPEHQRNGYVSKRF